MSAEDLQQNIGYRFQDPRLLRNALTHRSFSSEHNERLEFLGDSVVNCAVAHALYLRFPDLPEGELSRLRASLVNESSLAMLGQRLDLGALLRLGEGELKSGGASRPSILADSLEALFGAVCMDGGLECARETVWRVFKNTFDSIQPSESTKDSKTLLQEWLQGRHLPLPSYTIISVNGEAHDQQFEVECALDTLGIRGRGNGTSRRRAEQEAARRAYEQAVRT